MKKNEIIKKYRKETYNKYLKSSKNDFSYR